jgi:hypothetical protein
MVGVTGVTPRNGAHIVICLHDRIHNLSSKEAF